MTTIELPAGTTGTLLRPDQTPEGDRVRKDFFIVSADCHVNEPPDLWAERIDNRYRHRIPRVEVDAEGERWSISEGHRPERIRDIKMAGEDQERAEAGSRDPVERLRDQQRDGVDAEVIFPNKGMKIWATPDPVFSQEMARVYNDWAWETFGEVYDTMSPAAAVATGDIEGCVEEIYRVAKLGFRAINFPVKPVHASNPDHERYGYNLPMFDPIWAAMEDVGLPITFHIATGKDPRTSGGYGGAVINYAWHALPTAIEPVIQTCSSGMFDRFPKLSMATIEAGCGWIAWALWAADEAYEKHHFYVRPKLKMLPSEYYRQHWWASFQDDPMGVDAATKWFGLDRLLWGNDYPHHEGTWPRSGEVIHRQMGHLEDRQLADVLGLSAARLFGFNVPEDYRYQL